MNLPATEAVCVTDPVMARGPAHGVPFAPPPLALQVLAFGTFQESWKLPPREGCGAGPNNEIPGEPIVTTTLPTAGGWPGSMLGHEREKTASS